MASGITTAFWSMTINNYDETDLAMVQNGYPDYMREIVYTIEKGKEGTPHIQAYVKLQRQQRLSFVKKLFPRGHFKPLTSDVYIANTKAYAQKLDGTAVSAAVHKFNDPTHTLESVIKRMVIKIIEDDSYQGLDLDVCKRFMEKEMVKEDYRYAKVFVSTTYSQMWKRFGHEMYENIFHTHTTHTHTDEKKSVAEGITDIDARSTQDEGRQEDYSCSGSEGTNSDCDQESASGSSVGSDEGSDDECSEQDTESEE